MEPALSVQSQLRMVLLSSAAAVNRDGLIPHVTHQQLEKSKTQYRKYASVSAFRILEPIYIFLATFWRQLLFFVVATELRGLTHAFLMFRWTCCLRMFHVTDLTHFRGRASQTYFWATDMRWHLRKPATNGNGIFFGSFLVDVVCYFCTGHQIILIVSFSRSPTTVRLQLLAVRVKRRNVCQWRCTSRLVTHSSPKNWNREL